MALAACRGQVSLAEEGPGRLASIIRARPLRSAARAACAGRATPAEAMAAAAQASSLVGALASRARTALAR